MKFLWRIFFAVYVAFLIIVIGISYLYTERAVSTEYDRFIVEKKRTGTFVAEEIEFARLRSEWPFGLLRKLKEDQDFQFWWIADREGQIYQSDDMVFAGSDVNQLFPEVGSLSGDAHVFIDHQRHLGVFVKTFGGGGGSYSLWLGYSTNRIENIRRRSLILTIGISFASLGVFGLALFLIIQHLTSPLDELVKGTHALRDGNFDYRVKVNSEDELGKLGKAFNDMAHEIQSRTESLRQSEDDYRSTIDSMNEFVVVVDSGQRVVIANKSIRNWLKGLGVDHEISARTVQDAIGMLDRDCQNRLEDAFKNGELSGHEVKCRVNDREILLEANYIPMGDSHETQHVLVVLIDVTEKRRMADELLKVQKLDSLSVLAGGIAHDFNNILGAIASTVSVAAAQLKRGDEKESIIADLIDVENEALRAVDLTSQLLTFSKGGAPVLNPGSLPELIRESTRFIMRGKKVQLRSELPEDLWPIKMDSAQISQVVQNIVMNACQAMPDGGMIEVKRENLTLDSDCNQMSLKVGPYVTAAFSDQGHGIRATDLPRIFDPFYSTKDSGHGLGLAAAYSIVKSHQGHIEVETEEGVGSCFRLYLPADPGVVLDQSPKNAAPALNGTVRILLMDDDASLRKSVKRMAAHLGHDITTCDDGTEAVRLYQEASGNGSSFDIVILDLTVPGGMGGEEVIEKLIEIDPSVQSIVTSGYSESKVLANFKDFGFRGVLPKPFNLQSFSEELQKLSE